MARSRPLPARLKLETVLHKHRTHDLEKLMPHVTVQPGTLLTYLHQLISERPYGHTTRLAARLIPTELMRQLLRIEPGVLCGRLVPLMSAVDGELGDGWRANPHRFDLLRLARECLRKRKARTRTNPSELCVVEL